MLQAMVTHSSSSSAQPSSASPSAPLASPADWNCDTPPASPLITTASSSASLLPLNSSYSPSPHSPTPLFTNAALPTAAPATLDASTLPEFRFSALASVTSSTMSVPLIASKPTTSASVAPVASSSELSAANTSVLESFPNWYSRLRKTRHAPTLFVYLLPLNVNPSSPPPPRSVDEATVATLSFPCIDQALTPRVSTSVAAAITISHIFTQQNFHEASLAAGYMFSQIHRRKMPVTMMQDFQDAQDVFDDIMRLWLASSPDTDSSTSLFATANETSASDASLAIAVVADTQIVDNLAALLATLSAHGHLHFNRYSDARNLQSLRVLVRRDVHKNKTSQQRQNGSNRGSRKQGKADREVTVSNQNEEETGDAAQEQKIEEEHETNIDEDSDDQEDEDESIPGSWQRIHWATHTVAPRPEYTPHTLIEWQLTLPCTLRIHSDPLALYYSLKADNQRWKRQESDSAREKDRIVSKREELERESILLAVPTSIETDCISYNATASSAALTVANTMVASGLPVPVRDLLSSNLTSTDASPFDWSLLLPISVLPLLSLPNIDLPPLPGYSLPPIESCSTVSALSRHTRTFTGEAAHAVYNVTMLPIELRPREDEEEESQNADGAFIARALARLTDSSKPQQHSRTHSHAPQSQLDLDALALSAQVSLSDETEDADDALHNAQFEAYSMSSKRLALQVIEKYSQYRVVNAFASAGSSVWCDDSPQGKTTFEFLSRFSAFQAAQVEFVSLHSSASRVYTRMMALPPGHHVLLIGAYSALWPLCLLLVNGHGTSGGQQQDKSAVQAMEESGSGGEALAPKEEIKALFERARHSILSLQAWNPPSALNKVESALVNAHQQHQPQPAPEPEQTPQSVSSTGRLRVLGHRSQRSQLLRSLNGTGAASHAETRKWRSADEEERAEAEEKVSEDTEAAKKASTIHRLSLMRTHPTYSLNHCQVIAQVKTAAFRRSLNTM